MPNWCCTNMYFYGEESIILDFHSCASPNAVYGIETPYGQMRFRIPLFRVFGAQFPFPHLNYHGDGASEATQQGCAPPNAVYGIETSCVADQWPNFFMVVRRLMPFTALKLLAEQIIFHFG